GVHPARNLAGAARAAAPETHAVGARIERRTLALAFAAAGVLDDGLAAAGHLRHEIPSRLVESAVPRRARHHVGLVADHREDAVPQSWGEERTALPLRTPDERRDRQLLGIAHDRAADLDIAINITARPDIQLHGEPVSVPSIER